MAAIRNVFASIGTALAYPRVWLSCWLVVTCAALLAVWPYFAAVDAAMSTHPGATFRLSQALDFDFAQNHPEATISLAGGTILLLLFGAFVAGGVLATVGVRERFKFTDLMVESGRLFIRNVRVLIGGVVALALCFWGATALETWLVEDVLYDTDPGAVAVPLWLVNIRWAHVIELLNYAWGGLFLLIVLTSKIAMAHLAVSAKRSALVAWLVAVGRILRSPWSAFLTVALTTVLWFALAHGIGIATRILLEQNEILWAGLLVGQIGVMWGQVMLVAQLVIARRFLAGLHKAEGAVEPVVELPRKAPVKPPRKADKPAVRT